MAVSASRGANVCVDDLCELLRWRDVRTDYFSSGRSRPQVNVDQVQLLREKWPNGIPLRPLQKTPLRIQLSHSESGSTDVALSIKAASPNANSSQRIISVAAEPGRAWGVPSIALNALSPLFSFNGFRPEITDLLGLKITDIDQEGFRTTAEHPAQPEQDQVAPIDPSIVAAEPNATQSQPAFDNDWIHDFARIKF
jgi:hypothetical protein